MKGFFPPNRTVSISRPNGKLATCASCGLYTRVKSPRLEAWGNMKKRILNIGSFPEETDDNKGVPFQGKKGRRLQREFQKLGIDLFEDCVSLNAVNCYPITINKEERAPTKQEIACCRSRVFRVIKSYKPDVIIVMGDEAIFSILGHRWKKDFGTIHKWRGWVIPDRDIKAWICPIYSLEMLENSALIELDNIWRKDLQNAVKAQKIPFPYDEDETRYIEFLESPQDIDLGKFDLCAFDYETTGLKPHAPGHRIVCASLAISEKKAVVFPIPETRKERKPFTDILADPKIRKIAHNMKFEQAWSVVRLRQPVSNWWWDCMLASHILDNRQGISGLKFQTYVNFGVIDYSSEVDPYLRSKESKNSNAINQIMIAWNSPTLRKALLTYCALDSIYEFKLAMKQQEVIRWTK